MFKKMLAALGVGGPSVDTVLSSPDTQPGRTLQGEVNIVGGDVDVDIEYVALSLVTRGELGDDGPDGAIELTRATVSGAFTLPHSVRVGGSVGIPDHRRVRTAASRNGRGSAHRTGGGQGGRQDRPGRRSHSPAE